MLQLAEFLGDSVVVSGSVRMVSTSGITAFALYNNVKSGGSFFAGISAE